MSMWTWRLCRQRLSVSVVREPRITFASRSSIASLDQPRVVGAPASSKTRRNRRNRRGTHPVTRPASCRASRLSAFASRAMPGAAPRRRPLAEIGRTSRISSSSSASEPRGSSSSCRSKPTYAGIRSPSSIAAWYQDALRPLACGRRAPRSGAVQPAADAAAAGACFARDCSTIVGSVAAT